MSLQIGNVKLNNPLVLAPMAGFSNVALRVLAKEYGAGLTTTEMVSAKSLEYGNEHSIQLLATGPSEDPVAVQIFGSDPVCMANACKSKELSKFDIIDINMGCPTPKIVKNGDGSALLSNMDLAEEIIRSCVKATNKPITVKFRIGVDNNNIVAIKFAQMCERAGASAITVHGRTVVQGYSGKSNLDVIKQVKQNVNIPVIASGDCVDYGSCKHILDYTGADGVMIGRAAIGSPEIFAECLNQKVKVDKLKQIKQHIDILKQYYDDRFIVLHMRGVICHYLKRIKNTAVLKTKIVQATSINQMLKLLEEFFNQ